MPIVADAAARVRADMSGFRQDMKEGGEKATKTLGQQLKSVFSKKNLAIAGVAGGIALAGAITAGLAGAVKALIDIQRLNAQTDAVIKSTGGAANVTRKQIEEAAEAAEAATTIEREAVQEAQNMLLTFTKVRNEAGKGNDIFYQATDAVLDMSTALGTDATSSAVMLGKALNDPVRGMLAMTRAGIQFTDQQKEMIASMVAAGDMLGAQKIILAELETQFGGSAEAFADTTAGRIQRFQNDVGNMFESIVVGATMVGDALTADPYKKQAEILKANAASMGVDMGNRYAEGIAASVASVRDAADTTLRDPLIEAMLGGKEEAARIAGETPGAIAQALLDKQFSVEDASASLQQAAEDALHPMIERAQIIAFLSSQGLADGLADGLPAVRARAQELKAAAEARLAELQGVSFTYGFNTGTSYAAGLNAAYGYVIDAAGNLAAATRGQIGIQSEPSDPSSPLRGITKWGGNIAKELAGGMLGELLTLRGAAGKMAGALVPSVGGNLATAAAGGAMAGGGPTFILQVEGKPPLIGSREDVLDGWEQLARFKEPGR